MLNIIDIFDRSIVDYHMVFHCEANDAVELLKYTLIKRNLYGKETVKPVMKTDNGSQFVSYKLKEYCEEFGLQHERIPVKTPNKNAHVESFHRIL
ncbi:DDE-type integrase/transposase/recombinase [Clostridium tyrobutyricum]|jgi:putative transposase|uniref:DDE-type integrase/transposase/recombinase n=1 Tax=Clostridium tyrobutyricum TaxID=1519 RepID=UPI0018AAFD0B|nr:DDE-type integrase/transposase/recombinase [Clostridium tyrobutyricum]MBV4428866.1 DDE-type integrase/transposase/recombinase [Clostridium tyrobutyricum]